MPPFPDLALPRRGRLLASSASLLLHGLALAALIWGAHGAAPPRTPPTPFPQITLDVIAIMPAARVNAPNPAPSAPPTASSPPTPQATTKPPRPLAARPAASTAPAPRTQSQSQTPSPTPANETATGAEEKPATLPGGDLKESNTAAAPVTRLETHHEARFDAAYLNNPRPVYPPLARRNGETGTVTLNVQVSETGQALAVSVKTSSGSARLDKSALDTVMTWRFVPASRGDTPISSWVVVPIAFVLQ